MRIWGRVAGVWTAVETTADGSNDYVYVTNLIQVLKLSRNESPFFANYGIPAQLSVLTQIIPDIYVFQTQRQFAPFFAALIISRIIDPTNPDPQYRVNLTTHQGVEMNLTVPV